MDAWHQRNLTFEGFPYNLFITDISEFPPHWHDEIEIVYALEEELVIGLNNEIFTLHPRDILVINSGEVHFFITPPKKSKRLILQFELTLFESCIVMIKERRFLTPLIQKNGNDNRVHRRLEDQITAIKKEYSLMYEGQQSSVLAIKARLYDLMVILLRQVPMENYSPLERNKYLKRLERLEQVFKFVEQNYTREISLKEIAQAANFSIYHFTRFFKEATGMTFTQYLNNYRISKAAKYLTNYSDSITEIAFKVGFESIKTFNRVFKQIKRCSPTVYKKMMIQ